MFDALERFTLLDVEGILLDNPGDELPIVEPVGFRDLLMTIQRDEEYRGMTAEFGEGETELGFDWNKEEGEDYSGHELVRAVIEASGSDGKVFLRYYRTENSVETLEYEWILILKSAEEEDAIFFVRVKKEDFGDKLRTRFDTDINVAGTKDLDDTTVAACPMITLPLHSRLQRLRIDADSEDENGTPIISSYEYDTDNALANTNQPFYGTITFPVIELNELPTYTPPTEETKITSPVDDENVLLRTGFKGKVTTRIQLAFDWGATSTASNPPDYGGTYQFRIVLVVRSVTGTIKHTETVYNGDGSISDFGDNSIDIEDSIDETFVHTDIVKNDEFFLYWYFIPDFETELGDIFPYLDDFGISFTQDTGNLQITQLTEFPPSTIEGNFIFEVLNDALKKAIGQNYGDLITASLIGVTGTFEVGETVVNVLTTPLGSGTIVGIDGSTYTIRIISPMAPGVIEGQTSGASGIMETISYANPLDSSLLAKTENTAITDGLGSLNFVTTGKRIRQLPAPPLNVTCAKLIDFTRCRYNAGFMIREESDGSRAVVVEEASEFFNDVKIITLPNVQNSTKRLFNNDLLYNEFEAGFIKYAKENENNSIEGFNTKRSWLLPIEKDKKKLSLIAPVITDGAEIERVRRLEINQDESDQSDDEVFIIKCVRFNSSNPITEAGNDTTRNYVTIDDAGNQIILQGFYLNGQIEAGDSISYSLINLFTLYTQTVAIDSIEFDADNNRTILTVSAAIDAPDGDYASNYNFYFDHDIFLPERLESFTAGFVSGVVDKYTEYNIDHSPLTFLFYWFNFLGATLETKAGTKKIKFTTGVNNNDLSKRYKSGVGLTNTQMDEDQDWLLSSLRTYNPAIFTQFAWEVKSIMPFAQWKQVRQSLLGMVTPSSNYGYVDFYEESGNLVQIWPVKVTRNNVTEETTIIGWERNTETTGTNYILQETGDKIYRESSTGFLLRESAGSVPESGIIETEDGGGFLTEDGGFFELEG